MNIAKNLDGIKRTLRRIETQVGIIQRTNVIMFERITGGAFPDSWVIHDDEQAVLAEAQPVTNDELYALVDEHTAATNENIKLLTEWMTLIETQQSTGKDRPLALAVKGAGGQETLEASSPPALRAPLCPGRPTALRRDERQRRKVVAPSRRRGGRSR
jgi:hypothetical protein